MGTHLAQSWRWLLFRGVFAVLFRVSAILIPVAAIARLALVFAAYLLIDGFAGIGCALQVAHADGRWIWLIVEGMLGIVAGVVIALRPSAAILAVATLAAVWALVSRGSLVAAAFRVHSTHGGWLMMLSGAVSLLWGVLQFLSPISGAIVLPIWFGVYALIFGVMMIFLAFHLRGHRPAGGPTRPVRF